MRVGVSLSQIYTYTQQSQKVEKRLRQESQQRSERKLSLKTLESFWFQFWQFSTLWHLIFYDSL